METLTAESLRELRKSLGMTQDEFGKALGYTGVYIRMIETKKKPVANKFTKIVEATFGKKKEKHTDEDASNSHPLPETQFSPVDPGELNRVPVLGFAQASGYDGILEPIDDYMKGCADDYRLFIGAKPGWFALRVDGDSMEPEYPDGTMLLVAAGEFPRRGDIVAARINEGECEGQVVCKRYRRKDNVVTLESINPEGREYRWSVREKPGYVLWMWPVVQVSRDLRRPR